ncbi:MAG: methyltransferase domain-containing protein [Bacillota bacterium]|nr:methyltransferase domain-containing protein [Bacillota bacterium]
MIEAYSILASYYDELNSHVPYEKWADFIEAVFRRKKIAPKLVLDLACGTGTLTRIFSERGYEMIAADSSVGMLDCARKKCEGLKIPPVFVCQNMKALDLYGTVDAVVCCLDSINYLTKYKELAECFRKVHLFLEPGGLFIFDVNTPFKLRNISGRAFISEGSGVYCCWQASFSERTKLCRYDFDLFVRESGLWRRYEETHTERAYDAEEIIAALKEAGFSEAPEIYAVLKFRAPETDAGRTFFAVRKV